MRTNGTNNQFGIGDYTGNKSDWITVECEECGEDFATLKVIADGIRDKRCSDCKLIDLSTPPRDPDMLWVGESRPHMEWGPLSLGGR